MNEACLKTAACVQECTRRVKDEHEHRPKSICTNLLYLQLHIDDGSGFFTESICKIGFTQSKVNEEWYPYINEAIWPMNFGYSGYQFASIKQ